MASVKTAQIQASSKNMSKDFLRKIIHIDMDCFFAAVEMRDNPSLRSIPMAVGGNPLKRGVIATCNYQAREFGIHSAMASSKAIKLCPSLKIVPGSMDKYILESKKIKAIFSEFTELVEPLSLDEAYLDVSHSKAFGGSATLIAEKIRKKIFEKTGLTASAGVAPNKFLAKVASDWKKPNGLFVLTPELIPSFMLSLEVKKVPGVGKVTEKKLNKLDVFTCKDLQEKKIELLESHFGKFGKILKERSFGIDNRNVVTEYPRKSLSIEKTFPCDLTSLECSKKVPQLISDLCYRLKLFKKRKRGDDLYISKFFVKLKYEDFQKMSYEKSHNFPFYESLWREDKLSLSLYDYLDNLFEEALKRSPKKVRLMGAGVRFSRLETKCENLSFNQLELFT